MSLGVNLPRCLICGVLLPGWGALCPDHAKPLEGEWEPTTEWGRARKAARQAERDLTHRPGRAL